MDVRHDPDAAGLPEILTEALRKLERNRLVRRTVHPRVPPRVDNAPTSLGGTLTAPLHALHRRRRST
ncbi:MAG TPA: winged helix-turn-helix transcriptional regulator [Methylomirabilota bacterium]|nr:winged helix-turn-helix transcriptional regulator [Methylomirabilota bacterium]